MVKIGNSRWLRPSDVKDGDVVTIVNEGQKRSAEETPFKRAVFEIAVRLPSGEEKILTMNSTTQRRCMEAWGNETRNWIGKRLRIELREQNVRGVIKRVIYGYPLADRVSDTSAANEDIVTIRLTVQEVAQLMALLSKIGKQLESRRDL